MSTPDQFSKMVRERCLKCRELLTKQEKVVCDKCVNNRLKAKATRIDILHERIKSLEDTIESIREKLRFMGITV